MPMAPSSVPLAAVIPLIHSNEEDPQAVFVALQDLPQPPQLTRWAIEGVELWLWFNADPTPRSIPLGPAEWHKLHQGLGQLYAVDDEGEPVLRWPLTSPP